VSEVLTEVVEGVLVITINRPEVRNAVNTATALGIAQALDDLDKRDDVTCGVLTGAGSTFCTGMDLKAFLAGERPSLPKRGFAGIVEQPPEKPLIAAVEGYALAGGFEIALACDLIVAASDAAFGLPEVKRGLVAAGGGLLRLPERAPYHLVAEWALTGRFVPAAEAASAFLVNRLTPPGGALAGALEIAKAIAANGPLAVKATKRILSERTAWAPDEAFARQREISEPVRASEDAKEGARAFTERRPPVWRSA
jgi:enoyl-CoA hydratase